MWAAQARAPWKMEWTQHQPQSRNIPAPSCSAHIYTCCLSLMEMRIWPPGNHEERHVEDQDGRPRPPCVPKPGEETPSVHCAGGLEGPGTLSNILRPVPQWAVASAHPTLPRYLVLQLRGRGLLLTVADSQPLLQGHQLLLQLGFLLPQLGHGLHHPMYHGGGTG